MRDWLTLTLLLCIGVVGFLGWRQHNQIQQLENEADSLAIEILNVEARNDTTVENLVAGVRFFSRQVVQERERADSLEEELGVERKTRTALVITLDSLKSVDTTTVVEDSVGVRSAHFSVEEEAFEGEADVSLPAPPDPGQLWLNLRVRPLQLNIRLGCEIDPTGRASRAYVLAEGPAWSTIGITDVVQAPEICNPPRVVRSEPWWKTALKLGAGLLVGVAIAR